VYVSHAVCTAKTYLILVNVRGIDDEVLDRDIEVVSSWLHWVFAVNYVVVGEGRCCEESRRVGWIAHEDGAETHLERLGHEIGALGDVYDGWLTRCPIRVLTPLRAGA
jgi:hypothetical protein